MSSPGSVPVIAYSKPGKSIALRHAMKNYLGRGLWLAAVIRAVVDGSLEPVGYRPAPGLKLCASQGSIGSGFLSYPQPPMCNGSPSAM